MSALYDRSAEMLRGFYDRRLSAPPVLDLADGFADARRFTQAWPALRDEALALAGDLPSIPRFHELMAAQADISANDARDWRMFVLKAYGVEIGRNMARCPQLASLVRASPDVLTATLSFLAPGKHIPLHRGPFRGVSRFYLGLSVPMAAGGIPAVSLTIDGVVHRIGNGEALLWDDTFPHEVKNDSGQWRIALLMDIRRRDLPRGLQRLSRLLVGVAGIAVRFRGIG
jgi:aspartate beta-hydroxylase